MSNLGPQFAKHEADLIRRRSVWQEAGNEHHVQGIVDKHSTDAPDLYRGISVSPTAHNYIDPSKVKVGDRLHLPVSSFTSDRETGVNFAHAADNDENHHGDYTPVLFHAQGARGVNVEHASNMPWEKEWLSHGQFEVTHKTSDPDNNIPHVIGLRPTK